MLLREQEYCSIMFTELQETFVCYETDFVALVNFSAAPVNLAL